MAFGHTLAKLNKSDRVLARSEALKGLGNIRRETRTVSSGADELPPTGQAPKTGIPINHPPYIVFLNGAPERSRNSLKTIFGQAFCATSISEICEAR